jgi:hypothetical protein
MQKQALIIEAKEFVKIFSHLVNFLQNNEL